MPAKRVDIVKIKLVRESSILYAARSVSSPRDTAEFFRTLLGDADREHFVVMCLNARNEPNAVQVVSTGTLSATLVHPREIFKAAILANAHAVVLAHNQPSGDPAPSREDLEVTRRLSEAGQLLGIEVLDHVIVGANERFVSLRERGQLAR